MRKAVFFDVTFLEFGRDMRGIPQVILQLVRLFRKEDAFIGVHFISTPAITSGFLRGLGIPDDRIVHVPRIPWLGRFERFHGLFSTFRYRKIIPRAALIIHPELRTIVRAPVPQMIFYYDFIIFERVASGERRKWMRYLLYLYKNHRAAKARFKVAISEFTRRRALELFPSISPESVTSKLLGGRMQPVESPRQVSPPGTPLRFLYVGSYEARKNMPALLGNLGQVAGPRRALLQLVGSMGPERERQLQALAKTVPENIEVIFRGLLGDGELQALYRQTDFLLFPSLFEGFGLPVVEAMAHGTVACAFRNSSLPEVGGDAVLLAENGDFAAWGRAIAMLAGDPDAYREASLRSIRRAGEFTEEKMHERYKDFFLKAFSESDIRFSGGAGP